MIRPSIASILAANVVRTRWSPVLVGVLVAACAGGAPSVTPASLPPVPGSPAMPTPVPTPAIEPSPEPSAEPVPTPSGGPTAAPATPMTRPTPGPTPEATSGATLTPSGEAPECPTAPILLTRDFVDADPACFGSRDVMLHAWLDGLPSMGWEAPYIDLKWLAYPPNVPLNALWQRGPGGDAMCGGDDDCAYVIIHLRPGTTIGLGNAPRWVIATGHLADPMAAQCHYEPWGGTSPPDSEAQAECRASFVLTAIRDAPPVSQ